MKKIISLLLSLVLLCSCFVLTPVSAGATAEKAKLTIESKSITVDDDSIIEIKFTLSGAPSADAIGIENITYNTEEFELVSGVWTLPSGTSFKRNYDDNTGNGNFAASAMYNAPKDLNAEIFTLTLEAINPGEAAHTAISCGFSLKTDEGTQDILSEVSNGEANIHDFSAEKKASAALKAKADCENDAEYYYSCTGCEEINKSDFFTAENSALGHSPKSSGNYAATCKKAGWTGKTVCSRCGDVVNKGKALAKKAHKSKATVTKATTTKNGYIKYICSDCGTATAATKTIYAAKSVKLSTTEYTYNGKTRKPKVYVKDSKGKTISSSYYTVTNKGGKAVGKYSVKITFKGNYSGSKTLNFTITPPETSVKKVTGGKKSLKVTWTKKTSQVTGYQIQYATNKSFISAKTANVTKAKTTSTTIKKLSAKKTYYVRIRTYKTVGKTKYYSDWSARKSAKTK